MKKNLKSKSINFSKKTKPKKRFSTRSRLWIVGSVFLALFGSIYARLWYLQVLKASTYSAAAAAIETRKVLLPAPRGNIYSRSGTVLVGNKFSLAVALTRIDAAQYPGVVTRLAKLLKTTPSSIQQTLKVSISGPYSAIAVAKNIPKSTAIYIKEHSSQFRGVIIEQLPVVSYPNGTAGAHLLGYVGPISARELAKYKSQGYTGSDVIGKDGVEKSFQNTLRGKPGSKKLQVNAQGQIMKTISSTAPSQGNSVQLTLDSQLQNYIDATIPSILAQDRRTYDPATHSNYKATSASVVVMNPNTGSVLAMASYPTYNPSLLSNGISYSLYKQLQNPANNYPLINRTIQGLYAPGSTFKLATASAALQTGLFTPNTIINDTGYYTVPNCSGPGCRFHNSGHEALGPINIVTGLAASDDVFFYNVGGDFWMQRNKYGLTPIQNWAHKWGLGRITGIQLPSELKGTISNPKTTAALHAKYPKAYPYGGWYIGQNVIMAIGQGATVVTPLQLADAYSAFANGGTLYRPRVASAILSPTGKVVKKISPVVRRVIHISPTTRNTLMAGFEGVITNPLGTAYPTFRGFPYSKFPLAAKTGTSQANGQQNTAVFVAFGPTTHPQYVVSVVVPQGGFGAAGAAPLARDIFQWLMAHPLQQSKLPSVKP